MGGSSSRVLSRRGSKRRRKREQSQQSEQQEVLPTERSSLDSHNACDTRRFEWDGHDTMTSMDNQTGFNQFEENQWGVEDYSDLYDTQRDSYPENYFGQPNGNNNPHLSEDIGKFGIDFENLNSHLQRKGSANDKFEERQFRRPVRRHHSFNENRFQFQSDQGTSREYSSRVRCNSLIDLHDRGVPFEEQYMGNRFTNFSSFNIPRQYHHSFDRSSPYNSSAYDVPSSAGRGGVKRYSCSDYSDDISWGGGSNGACEEMFDSPVRPRVKRRQSDERQSIECLSDVNRNENERSHSGLSFYSNRDSTGSNVATSLPDEECGALNILSFPSEWSSCAVNKTGYVNISFSSPEGKSVLKFFQRTCKSKDTYLSISGIIRIENPFLHTLYLLKKEEMTVKHGHVDELFLYHGTKKRFVTNICENNLDWRQYSEKHRFGKGVSFSPSAIYSSHYSDDVTCDKVLMLFKVLVSNTVLGLPEMNIPSDEEGGSYDTSIKEDASVIVKYYDNEFYPLYKILYKKK